MMNYARTDDLDACFKIRKTVFIDEQNVPKNLEIDGLDAQCLQYLATDNGQPVATCRVQITGDTAKVQRVAVLKSHRGQGIGRELMRHVIKESVENPAINQIKLGAQISAAEFYTRLGFEKIGALYMDAGIEHIDMIKDVS